MIITALDLRDAKSCKQWDEYLSHHGAPGYNCQTSYLRAIVAGFNHRNLSIMLADNNGNIVGVCPIILTKSLLFGCYATSLPFFNYGGIIADNPDLERKLLDEGIKIARASGASSFQLRESTVRESWQQRYPSLQRFTHKVHMRLDVPAIGAPIGEGNGKQRAKLKSQAHLAVRKAEDQNTTVETKFGHLELLNDFYRVFSQHMRDLGTPVYSKKWFKTMLQTFGKNSSLVVVYFNKRPAAVAFLIKHGTYMNIPWASALKCYSAISINTHMYWNIIKHAQDSGVTCLDFGRSTEGEGTYRFKRQWGAVPYPCHWYNKPLSTEGKVDNLSPTNPKFSLAIKVWQRLPVWLTKIIGPSIVKSIP